jgi:hypothetical protein
MWLTAPTVPQHVVPRAAGVFEGVGQNGQHLEIAGGLHMVGHLQNILGSPVGIEGRLLGKGIAKDFPDQRS